MEYAENLPAPQSKRTLVASLVALVIGAAAATGIWALADDDSSATASGASGPTAGAETPGSQYGTSQYRLTNPPRAGASSPQPVRLAAVPLPAPVGPERHGSRGG
jgi:hypothetical protein